MCAAHGGSRDVLVDVRSPLVRDRLVRPLYSPDASKFLTVEGLGSCLVLDGLLEYWSTVGVSGGMHGGGQMRVAVVAVSLLILELLDIRLLLSVLRTQGALAFQVQPRKLSSAARVSSSQMGFAFR